MSRPLYAKLFTRDFSLAVVEVWGRAEGSAPKPWTDEPFPFSPYIVFERTEAGVSSYIDERGIAWMKERLVAKAKEDPTFIPRIEREISDSYGKVQASWTRPALEQTELITFLADFERCWGWLEAGWWLWETTPEERDGLAIPPSLIALRERTQDWVTGSDRLIRDSLRACYPEAADMAEVISGMDLVAGTVPQRAALEKRLARYFLANDELLIDATASDIEERFGIELETRATGGADSVHGQTGYSGTVRGAAKIVFGTKTMDKVLEGDILVAPMTLPDILPAMKKAAAFVTDEGGIMCHAAIAAREMRKPCVIGTKHATQVFKDGDLVEVDGQKGIVRKL